MIGAVGLTSAPNASAVVLADLIIMMNSARAMAPKTQRTSGRNDRNHGLRGHNHGGRVRRKPVGFVSVERWQVYARWRMVARPDCEA